MFPQLPVETNSEPKWEELADIIHIIIHNYGPI